jgi:hypothetical protein
MGASVTPEEIREYADLRAEAYGWDAAVREAYRQQLARAERRRAEAQAALATPVRPLSSRAEIAAAGYGIGPAPSLATHASQVGEDGRVVHPPVIAERMAEAEEEARLRWAARMAPARPLRRPDGTLMHSVYELDYDVLNSIGPPT